MRKSIRLRFEEHENKYEWLSTLLRAYYQNDTGTYNEMLKHFKKKKTKIACFKGCYDCCLNPVVPITEIELMGISWYVSEIIKDANVRDNLKAQMKNYKDNVSCPFLVNGECSIYPLRPIACREFHVIGEPCTRGQDPIKSRPNDIWTPSRKVARKTAMKLLPAFGFSTQREMLGAYEDGYIRRNSRDMNAIDWSEIVKVMNQFDSA